MDFPLGANLAGNPHVRLNTSSNLVSFASYGGSKRPEGPFETADAPASADEARRRGIVASVRLW